VEDLLVLSRAEGGVLTVESEPVHLGRLIARVIASEQARWPRSQVVTSVESGLPPVEGDETLIEQVLRNLVSNAAKYAGSAGPVMVTATVREPWVEVRVTDHGPGLTDEDIAQVFELFYRAPSAATKAPGAGIGLYACHELAVVMGGELVAGRGASGGAEFTFRLRPIDVEIG
jgi:two-component system sensor histidine kinase KdpD